MKSFLVKKGYEQLFLEDTPPEKLAPHEVRVAVKAVSLNYRDLLNLKFQAQDPFVAMSDGAGEVIEIGSNVKDLKVGDRVIGLFFPDWQAGKINAENSLKARGGNGCDGMLAEQVVGDSDSFVKFPDHLTYREAATLPCAGLTAWNALFEYGEAKLGDTVVIQGTGGVGLYTLQLAKAAGLNTILLSSKDHLAEKLTALGADAIINYKKTPNWDEEVIRLTEGKGADIVIELGGSGTLQKSLNAVKVNGYISMIGVLSGLEGTINPLPIIAKSINVKGVYVGSKEMQNRFHEAMKTLKLKPVLDDSTFDFEDSQDAYEYQSKAKHIGNVVISIA
ncbi:zinc-dependent alcohol dehydrogenase family protein [Vibrio harveyi]|uniref:zinc-dependent alcohol dehydrogenase family protein n=1 Tax=Vibrio harveyi TaxID=669 RepID=UPI0033583AF2